VLMTAVHKYTVEMSFLMLQLSLFVVTVTSSKYSHVVIQQPNSCARNDQVLTELKTTVSQIKSNQIKMQQDVAKLNGGGPPTGG